MASQRRHRDGAANSPQAVIHTEPGSPNPDRPFAALPPNVSHADEAAVCGKAAPTQPINDRSADIAAVRRTSGFGKTAFRMGTKKRPSRE